MHSIGSAAAMGTLLLTGCASIVGGQIQSLSVRAEAPGNPSVEGAVCDLSNDKGTWYLTTPGSAAVQRSFQDLVVRCRKDGYAPGETLAPSTTKSLAFGNVLFGGLIGVGVDVATGAAYDYPNELIVLLAPRFADATPPTPPAAASSPTLMPTATAGWVEYRVLDRLGGTGRVARVDANAAGHPGTGDLDVLAPPQGWVPADLSTGSTVRLNYVARDGSPPSRVSIVGRVEPATTVTLAMGAFQAVQIRYNGWLDRFAGPFPVSARGEFALWVDAGTRRVLKFESNVQTASGGPNQAPGSRETVELSASSAASSAPRAP